MSSWYVIAPLIVADPVFAGLVLVFAFQRGAVSRLLQRGPFVLVGTISYSLYMIPGFEALGAYNIFLEVFAEMRHVQRRTTAPVAAGRLVGEAAQRLEVEENFPDGNGFELKSKFVFKDHPAALTVGRSANRR